MDAGPPVRRERLVVGRVDVHAAKDDEEAQDQQLHHDHDVVGARALTHPAEQKPGDREHDEAGWHVHEDGDAGDARRGLQQPVNAGIGAQKRCAITRREPHRQMDEAAGERLEVVTP